MKPTISLHFNGQCEAAFRFYEQCLPGKVTFMLTWGNSPMAKDVPPEWATKICHATFMLGDTSFSGGDVLQENYSPPKGFGMVLSGNDAEEAERVFNALAQNGAISVPMQQTFWARRYGCAVDQFGVPWEINCEK